jgi:hypothetical protein
MERFKYIYKWVASQAHPLFRARTKKWDPFSGICFVFRSFNHGGDATSGRSLRIKKREGLTLSLQLFSYTVIDELRLVIIIGV